MPRDRSSLSPKTSSRQEFREMRRQRERRNRILVASVILIGALLLVIAFALPAIQKAISPAPTVSVENVTPIVPVARPRANGTAMGDPNAPVKIDVWEDFQCPACVQYTQVVEAQLAETYVAEGKAYYVFHVFPFLDDYATTQESDQAANASFCADEQERFWDYHDILFANWNGENEGAFADARLSAFAKTLGMDVPAFEACLAENRYQARVDEDLQAGLAMGVNGTPSVFVNGVIVKPGYVPSYEDMVAAIEAALSE
ncbi:MAG: DsbA family protein [Chloroflexota bacterium]